MWLEVMREFSCKAVSARSSCDDWKEQLSHGKAWGRTRDYHHRTTSWDHGRPHVPRTHTTKSSYAAHGIITMCMLQHKKRRARSGRKCKEETRMGRLEAGRRGIQRNVMEANKANAGKNLVHTD